MLLTERKKAQPECLSFIWGSEYNSGGSISDSSETSVELEGGQYICAFGEREEWSMQSSTFFAEGCCEGIESYYDQEEQMFPWMILVLSIFEIGLMKSSKKMAV